MFFKLMIHNNCKWSLVLFILFTMSCVYLFEHIYFRSLMWAAYMQFTWWVHGKLGRSVHRVLPACASHLIRTRFIALARGRQDGSIRLTWETWEKISCEMIDVCFVLMLTYTSHSTSQPLEVFSLSDDDLRVITDVFNDNLTTLMKPMERRWKYAAI